MSDEWVVPEPEPAQRTARVSSDLVAYSRTQFEGLRNRIAALERDANTPADRNPVMHAVAHVVRLESDRLEKRIEDGDRAGADRVRTLEQQVRDLESKLGELERRLVLRSAQDPPSQTLGFQNLNVVRGNG